MAAILLVLFFQWANTATQVKQTTIPTLEAPLPQPTLPTTQATTFFETQQGGQSDEAKCDLNVRQSNLKI